MIGYALRRLAAGVAVLWVVATVTFALLRFLPGGPFDKERVLPPEIMRNLERRYALDGTLARAVRATTCAGSRTATSGRRTSTSGATSATSCADAVPVSMELGGAAFALAVAGGIALGLAAGARRDTARGSGDRARVARRCLGAELRDRRRR